MRIFLTIAFTLISFVVFSQKIKVLDKETGKPISNVNVFTSEGKFNSFTDALGNIDLKGLKDSDVLIFSHISYAIFQIEKSKIQQIVFLRKE